MRNRAALLIFVLVISSYLLGQTAVPARCLPAMEYQPQVVSNPNNLVTFHCERATLMDLIHAVGFQTRLPLGVVFDLQRQVLTESAHAYNLDLVDARTALRRALAGTGYSMKAESGVLVIMPSHLSSRQVSLLTHPFQDFRTGDRQSMVELGASLTMWVGSVVDPKRSSMESLLGSTNDERFTLRFPPGATTEQIANQIVTLGSKGIWIFKVAAKGSAATTDEVLIESYQHYSKRPV